MDHLLSREQSHNLTCMFWLPYAGCGGASRTLPTDACEHTDLTVQCALALPAWRPPLAAGERRHDEHTMDALALRAEEGRGTAPICLGEPLAGPDPRISE